jgi:hypothetical protein
VEASRGHLIGNRIALVGAVLYFLEWIAIALIPSVPTDKLGSDPSSIVASYSDPKAIGLAAGWFSVALFGRVIFTIGLRDSLRGFERARLLADVAVAAMALSVAIEVVSFGLAAAAAWIADAKGDPSAVVALDSASEILFALVFGPIGVSVLAGSGGMLLARVFSRWLAWVGVVGGALLTLGGIVGPGALGADGTFHDVGGALTSVPVPIVWVWMIVAAIVLWHAAPRRA